MKTPEEIKKGLECCIAQTDGRCEEYVACVCCPFFSENPSAEDTLAYIQQLEEREWELFNLLSSVWYTKTCYFKQEDGAVYSRVSGEYMTFDQAIDEFAGELTCETQLEAQVPKWISVEERLPPELEEVLILVKETELYGQYKEFSKSYFCQYIGIYDDGEWCTVWCHGHRYIKDTAKEPYADKFEVTHWMPLPEGPKEG